jgi:hypothetical protein
VACDYIYQEIQFISSQFETLDENIVIPVNDFVIFMVSMAYSDVYVDAPVRVEYNNFQFSFTTKPST